MTTPAGTPCVCYGLKYDRGLRQWVGSHEGMAVAFVIENTVSRLVVDGVVRWMGASERPMQWFEDYPGLGITQVYDMEAGL